MLDTGKTPYDAVDTTADTRPVILVANKKSGRNSRDREAIKAVQETLGAELLPFELPEQLKRDLSKAYPRMVVSAGGDGTAMATASALVGTGVPLGVLPLGTFNYFARGIGLPTDPVEAARMLASGRVIDTSVAEVNGQVFLNNASIGIYPAILKEREDVYSRFGRRRMMAHWSVIKTFFRFRKPMRVTMHINGETRTRRTALIFVARSSFQLERFGLEGTDVIENGGFAIMVVKAETRMDLFRMSLRLATSTVKEGVDYDLYRSDAMDVELDRHRTTLVAYDGEKRRMKSPLTFSMSKEPLKIVIPADPEK